MAAAPLRQLATAVAKYTAKVRVGGKKLGEFVKTHWKDLVDEELIEDLIDWLLVKFSGKDKTGTPPPPPPPPPPPAQEEPAGVPPPPPSGTVLPAGADAAAARTRTRCRWLLAGGAVLLACGGGWVLLHAAAQVPHAPVPAAVGLRAVLPQSDGSGLVLLRTGPVAAQALLALPPGVQRRVMLYGGILFAVFASGIVLCYFIPD